MPRASSRVMNDVGNLYNAIPFLVYHKAAGVAREEAAAKKKAMKAKEEVE